MAYVIICLWYVNKLFRHSRRRGSNTGGHFLRLRTLEPHGFPSPKIQLLQSYSQFPTGRLASTHEFSVHIANGEPVKPGSFF